MQAQSVRYPEGRLYWLFHPLRQQIHSPSRGTLHLAFSLPSPCGRVEIFDFGEGFYTDITSVILTPKIIMDSCVAYCGEEAAVLEQRAKVTDAGTGFCSILFQPVSVSLCLICKVLSYSAEFACICPALCVNNFIYFYAKICITVY